MKTNKIINYLFLIFLSLSSLGGCSVEFVTPKEKCIVTFNTNGGSYIPNQELEKGDRIQEPEDPINEGHTFINWTYQGREWDFFGYTVSEDMTLDANYYVNSYYVYLTKNLNDAGDVYGEGIYKYGKKVTISAETKSGYTFNGWYEDNKLVSNEETYTFTMSARNVSYEARYTANKYIITLNSEAEGVTISGITSGNAYDCGTSITLTASNIPSGYTIRWERSDGIIRYGDSYSFIVPSKNITITITVSFSLYTRMDNKIYFGEYPQTEVKDTSLINELNVLAGSKPTSSDTYNWTDYNYYVNGSISSYMFYQDIDIDSDGTYDYRGVYFTQYRPYCYAVSSSDTYQDDNGYLTNTIYWFSYDPIEWNILKEENGKALIITNLILDSQEYYPSNLSSMFEHNGGYGYANNYELSNIRKFLNDNFYNIAFNELQKEIIETTLVDNSAESTGYNMNNYTCNNTNDKMFLLSYIEAITYYSLNNERMAHGSDYAKSQGLYVYSSNGNSCWWFRSPGYYDSYCAYGVLYDGNFIIDYVLSTVIGVRAACQIIL